MIIEWGKIMSDSEYKSKYQEIISLYKSNLGFRLDSRDATNAVIECKFSEIKDVGKVIDEAVLYLIEELSFVLASPMIYGVQKVIYLYHQH